MEGKSENLSVNMGGINLMGGSSKENEPSSSIIEILPEKAKQEIENTDYIELGKGENSFLVFRQPLIEEPPENDFGLLGQSFLVIAMDREEKEAVYRKLTFETYAYGVEGVSIDNENAKIATDFETLINAKDKKNSEDCEYTFNKGGEILSLNGKEIKMIEGEKLPGLHKPISKRQAINLEKIEPKEFQEFMHENKKFA
jgi:hypothetical protein